MHGGPKDCSSHTSNLASVLEWPVASGDKRRRQDAPRVHGVPKVAKRAVRLTRQTHQHLERAAEPRGSVRVVLLGSEVWESSGLDQMKSWDTRGLESTSGLQGPPW